ncbi:MAG: patatin-like phospholipase family protein [Alphaproteobacteria bacterium]|jgi:NTE family protein
MTQLKIGLAPGSGVGRGWAHIGVLRGLEMAGIEVDVVAGTSIGALVAGVYLAGHLDSLETCTRSLNRIRIMRYLDLSLQNGGIIGGRRLGRIQNENLGDLHIEHLPRQFVVIATELATGHEIWLRKGHLVEALRAFSRPWNWMSGRWWMAPWSTRSPSRSAALWAPAWSLP